MANHGALKLVAELRQGLDPLLQVLIKLDDQIAALDRRLAEMAVQDLVTRRSSSVPGVSPVTSLTFKSCIDDPRRFRRSRDAGAYVGLRPPVGSSAPSSRSATGGAQGAPESPPATRPQSDTQNQSGSQRSFLSKPHSATPGTAGRCNSALVPSSSAAAPGIPWCNSYRHGSSRRPNTELAEIPAAW